MYGRQEILNPLLKSTYEEICMRIKFMCEQVPAADQVGFGDVIESYLSLQGHVLRKLPNIAIDNPNVDFAFVFTIGIILLSVTLRFISMVKKYIMLSACEALCANEIYLVKTATFFLTAFITTSREKSSLFKVIKDNGQFLVLKIICIISKLFVS